MVKDMTGAPRGAGTDAPTRGSHPSHPDIAVWRPASSADVDAIWKLTLAIGDVDHPNHVTTRAGIANDLGSSHFAAERDSLLGFDRDGSLVAMGMVICPPGQETLVRSILVGGVHPGRRGRGIGRQLLEWQVARAQQQLSAVPKALPGWILAYADERAVGNPALYAHLGFRPVRYFLSLERPIAEPIAHVALPEGIRVTPYRPELASAMLAVRNDSFRDHWASQPVTEEQWGAFLGTKIFRHDLSFAALGAGADGNDKVVGFLVATVNHDNWERQGFSGSYIDLLGVRRAWRGKRIGNALLAAHLQAARAAGYERATLTVDSANPTGAVGLYTGLGFYPTNREMAFRLEH
jgi:mycothiol synthase